MLYVVIIGGIYGAMCLFIYVKRASFMYFPEPEIAQTPADLDLDYDEVALTTSDGETLHAWFVPHTNARATILFCHGNAGNISGRLHTIRVFHELRLDVMIFDYRGYGQSTGTPSEAGTYRDAMAAWRYLTDERGRSADRIIICGRSMGGPIAAWLAEEVSPGMCILESTFTSAPDMAAPMFPFLPARYICGFRYNTRAHVANLRCPVLVDHSPEDEVIPYSHGLALFEAANEPKLFLTIGGEHGDDAWRGRPEYGEPVDAFITEHLGE